MINQWLLVVGQLVRGHQVASGQGEDTRYPGGTLKMQTPFFAERGLDLSPYFPGTLNVSIAPKLYQVHETTHRFDNVRWSPDDPAENFWFLDCRVGVSLEELHDGLIYYPDPETKPCHFQPPNVLEVLAPEIPDVDYGDTIWLKVRRDQVEIQD